MTDDLGTRRPKYTCCECCTENNDPCDLPDSHDLPCQGHDTREVNYATIEDFWKEFASD